MLESSKKIAIKLELKWNLVDDKLYKLKGKLLEQTVERNSEKTWRITQNGCKDFGSYVLEWKLLKEHAPKENTKENTYPLRARGELWKNLED